MATINGMKLMKDTCSLTSALLVNPNYTEPKVDMDVTECLWSDRQAWKIIDVHSNKKSFIMQRYAPKWIGKSYGDETYKYEDETGKPMLNHQTKRIVWRYGNWYEDLRGLGHSVKYSKIHLSLGYREEYRDPSF